jgi:hypothetical protein
VRNANLALCLRNLYVNFLIEGSVIRSFTLAGRKPVMLLIFFRLLRADLFKSCLSDECKVLHSPVQFLE